MPVLCVKNCSSGTGKNGEYVESIFLFQTDYNEYPGASNDTGVPIPQKFNYAINNIEGCHLLNNPVENTILIPPGTYIIKGWTTAYNTKGHQMYATVGHYLSPTSISYPTRYMGTTGYADSGMNKSYLNVPITIFSSYILLTIWRIFGQYDKFGLGRPSPLKEEDEKNVFAKIRIIQYAPDIRI